ncbi:MAG: retroviral-like aspartic protease family protein [Gemmatimonadota bacterium]|nr:retroviral-like aspartic protease family protein [Gemmatimonadota bacterium]MDQ3606800.1 retroviral-like aspartic protease family protein [Gemmatimonadota bacterium]
MISPRAATLFLVLGLTACAPGIHPAARGGVLASGREPTARFAVSEEARWAFWSAVATLDLRQAERRSPDRDHRRLVRALRQVMEGKMEEAEGTLLHLASTSQDSLLRTVSQVTVSSVLEFQGKWDDLHAISQQGNQPAPTRGLERAAIEAWAAVMRLAPPTEVVFNSERSVLPYIPAVTGTPIVQVRVNGEPRWFWIDTGTSVTLIASDVAEASGIVPLTADTLEMVTAVGITSARPAVIPTLEVGGLTMRGQTAGIVRAGELTLSVVDGSGLRTLVQIDGVIGMDIIRRVNLEIDSRQRRVRISRPRRSSADGERNLFWMGYPLIRLTQQDGSPLFFGLDTGADRTYATDALVAKLPGGHLRRERQRIAGFGADTTLTVPTLPALAVEINQRRFLLSGIAIHGPRRLGFVQLDGVLGNDTAAGLVMRIDVTNGIFELGLPFGVENARPPSVPGVRAPESWTPRASRQ